MNKKISDKLKKIGKILPWIFLIGTFTACYFESESYNCELTPNDEKLMTVLGFVTSRKNNTPVKNIKVTGDYGYTRTNEDGYFELMVYLDKKTEKAIITFEDDDGDKNGGKFKKKEISVKEFKIKSYGNKQIVEYNIELEKEGDVE